MPRNAIGIRGLMMRKFFWFLLFMCVSPVDRTFAEISADMETLGNQMIEGYQNSSHFSQDKKIAVLNFDELGTETKKNQIGQTISGLLIQKLSGCTSFKVVEREKLNLIFKELGLNMSGAVTAIDIKRTGLILGVDYLLLGSVSESENQFLIQARIVDVETAEIVTAKSITTGKIGLIKKSVEFGYLRRFSGVSIMGSRMSFRKMSFIKNGIGAELYYGLSNRNIFSLEIFKSINENDQAFGRNQWQIQAGIPYTVEARETLSSLFLISSKYKLNCRISTKTRMYFSGGMGLYMLNTEQSFVKLPFGSVSGPGVNLPAENSQNYTALGGTVSIDFQRYVNPYLRFGVGYSVHYFSFRRKLDPGSQNQDLMPQIENLNKRINVFGSSLSGRITFSF